MRRRTGTVVLGAVGLLLVLLLPTTAAADLRDEQALADRYAPVVRLVEQPEECGPGEPYEPMDVDRSSASRPSHCVARGTRPTSSRSGRRRRTSPGSTSTTSTSRATRSTPAATYERWARRLTTGHEPAVYAHVATDPAEPGKLALQYWFFYPFNDFNNTHEGDWEMIQLVFDAPDAAAALARGRPAEVGYSPHEGAERAAWGDDKLEVVDGTHPVVYPADGSHANSSRRRSISVARRRPASDVTTPGPARASSGRSCGRSRATRLLRPRRTRGSPTRAGGASSRGLSSTGRPART